MGFNCPNLVSLFICTDHTEFTHQKIGNYLVVKRMWKKLCGEVCPHLYFLKQKVTVNYFQSGNFINFHQCKYKLGTKAMNKCES